VAGSLTQLGADPVDQHVVMNNKRRPHSAVPNVVSRGGDHFRIADVPPGGADGLEACA